MATVQERIKALGLNKVNKSGGKRSAKRRPKSSLEQRIATLMQEGKPVPRHLAKKAEKIIESLKDNMPKSVEVETSAQSNANDELPAFDLPNFDLQEEVPDLIDMPSTVEDITDELEQDREVVVL